MPKREKTGFWAEVLAGMKAERAAQGEHNSQWECARCGLGNPRAASQCGCGADARLAAVQH